MTLNSGIDPSRYFAEFSTALARFEITTRAGGVLSTDDGIAAAVDVLAALKRQGRKALLVGNGGSAAIVSHLHNDLCKVLGVRALVFTEIPLLTALSNDEGYEVVFRRRSEERR